MIVVLQSRGHKSSIQGGAEFTHTAVVGSSLRARNTSAYSPNSSIKVNRGILTLRSRKKKTRCDYNWPTDLQLYFDYGVPSEVKTPYYTLNL